MEVLGKWKWRLGTEEKGTWRDIIVSKYGFWRNFNDFKSYSNESLWWKDLKKVCGNTVEGTWFDNSWKWEIGDGKRILFWEDVWCGDTPLKVRFSRLYNNSDHKGANIGDVGEWNENEFGVEAILEKDLV